jgi:hypothetical protein
MPLSSDGYLHAERHAVVRQHRFDGGPFIIAECVAHGSRLRFRSLNHVSGRAINPPMARCCIANALNLLPLSAAYRTRPDLLLARPGRE